jgi:hypothetical protein
VTRVNGVADRLKEVSAEIDKLEPALKAAAFPIAGVLSCRPVADTGKMSMHGYAVAIDLNLKYSDYWLWAGRGKSIPYKNRMPLEIVDIFERHGFIWGGKCRGVRAAAIAPALGRTSARRSRPRSVRRSFRRESSDVSWMVEPLR